MDKKSRTTLGLKLPNLKEGKHYMEDLQPAIHERTLLENPDPKESNTDQSKKTLLQLGLTRAQERDALIDYGNPREEMPKFTYGEDEALPFDKGAISIFRPYDFDARQQQNIVIAGRANHAIEDSLYDVTIENAKEKLKEGAQKGKYQGGTMEASPSIRAELRRASLMETTSSL